jgi:hypothetical protein
MPLMWSYVGCIWWRSMGSIWSEWWSPNMLLNIVGQLCHECWKKQCWRGGFLHPHVYNTNTKSIHMCVRPTFWSKWHNNGWCIIQEVGCLKKILGCLLHYKEWEPQPPTLLSRVDFHKKQNHHPHNNNKKMTSFYSLTCSHS